MATLENQDQRLATVEQSVEQLRWEAGKLKNCSERLTKSNDAMLFQVSAIENQLDSQSHLLETMSETLRRLDPANREWRAAEKAIATSPTSPNQGTDLPPISPGSEPQLGYRSVAGALANRESILRKVEMPVFNGSSPFGWIARAERYFRLGNHSDEQKMDLVSMNLEGSGLRWFNWELKHEPFRDWFDFKERLLDSFGESWHDRPGNRLCCTQQTGLIKVTEEIEELIPQSQVLISVPPDLEQTKKTILARDLRADAELSKETEEVHQVELFGVAELIGSEALLKQSKSMLTESIWETESVSTLVMSDSIAAHAPRLYELIHTKERVTETALNPSHELQQVSISVLESSHGEKLLVDFERRKAFEVQQQAMPLYGPISEQMLVDYTEIKADDTEINVEDSIKAADRIVAMDSGRFVEIGNHKELMRQDDYTENPEVVQEASSNGAKELIDTSLIYVKESLKNETIPVMEHEEDTNMKPVSHVQELDELSQNLQVTLVFQKDSVPAIFHENDLVEQVDSPNAQQLQFGSAVVIDKHEAYQMFDFFRGNRLHQRRKVRLFPKSWRFKFKQKKNIQVMPLAVHKLYAGPRNLWSTYNNPGATVGVVQKKRFSQSLQMRNRADKSGMLFVLMLRWGSLGLFFNNDWKLTFLCDIESWEAADLPQADEEQKSSLRTRRTRTWCTAQHCKYKHEVVLSCQVWSCNSLQRTMVLFMHQKTFLLPLLDHFREAGVQFSKLRFFSVKQYVSLAAWVQLLHQFIILDYEKGMGSAVDELRRDELQLVQTTLGFKDKSVVGVPKDYNVQVVDHILRTEQASLWIHIPEGGTKIDIDNTLIQLNCTLFQLHLPMAHKDVTPGGHKPFAIWHRWRIKDCIHGAFLHHLLSFQLEDKLRLRGPGIDRFPGVYYRRKKHDVARKAKTLTLSETLVVVL